ncbi:MAG: hypothetical protein B7Z26_11350, partial [Asticcacaulis sp. 32-58-5]
MSNKAMAWAVDCKVKGSHKLVLMLLAEAHNGHTGACFPSQEWITEKSGLGASTVSNCLQDLETWGLLSRHTKALGRGKGSRRANTINIGADLAAMGQASGLIVGSGDRLLTVGLA